MNEERLSRRLEAVARLVPKGSRIVDIGTDHAYLPVHLILSGQVNAAIATEVNDGPYQSATEQVQRLGLEAVIDVRKGDGLSVIHTDEVDTVIICGMGGALISTILTAGQHVLSGSQCLILQPNTAACRIRQWLLEHDWQLTAERIVAENHHVYEILKAVPGVADQPYRNLTAWEREKAMLMGPFLLHQKCPAFYDKWQEEAHQRQKIYAQLQQARDDAGLAKKKQIEHELRMIKEEIHS